jgi:integrase
VAKIVKTKAGTYTTRVFTGRNNDGKQLFEYVTMPTWHECRDTAREIEQQVRDKTYSSKGGMRATAAIDKWYELNEARLSPTTIRVYKTYLDRFKTYFGNLKLSKISDYQVREFINLLRVGGKLGGKTIKKQSETTLLKQYSVLNEILEEYLKTKNPCREVKAPEKDKTPRNILTVKQFSIVRNEIKGKKDEIPILLAALCGMRLGEIFGLTWGNIIFDTGIIRVTQSMVKTGPQRYIIKAPKSHSGIRDIISNDEVLQLLKSLKAKITSGSGIPQMDKLIFGDDDKPDRLSKRYETIIKNLGFAHTRFHDLRHYRATRMLAAGIPDIFASNQLGHYDVSMTKQYQHNTDDIVSAVKDKLKKLQ